MAALIIIPLAVTRVMLSTWVGVSVLVPRWCEWPTGAGVVLLSVSTAGYWLAALTCVCTEPSKHVAPHSRVIRVGHVARFSICKGRRGESSPYAHEGGAIPGGECGRTQVSHRACRMGM